MIAMEHEMVLMTHPITIPPTIFSQMFSKQLDDSLKEKVFRNVEN